MEEYVLLHTNNIFGKFSGFVGGFIPAEEMHLRKSLLRNCLLILRGEHPNQYHNIHRENGGKTPWDGDSFLTSPRRLKKGIYPMNTHYIR